MKAAVNLVYKSGNVKKFFAKTNKLYKEADLNDQAKFGLIRKANRPDQGMLQFVFLRNAATKKKAKETCLECTGNQKVFASQVEEEQVREHAQANQPDNRKEKFHIDNLEKADILCEKLEQLALLISNYRSKKSLQDIIYHNCKKPGYHGSQCQLTWSTT